MSQSLSAIHMTGGSRAFARARDTLATPPSEGADWCRFEMKGSKKARVDIMDEIGYWGTDARTFVKNFAALDATEIDLHLNSPGGDVFDGLAIMNAIKDHKATVTVTVEGLAASAASFIAMAGDKIIMNTGAQMMIHEASALAYGEAKDMVKMADRLETIGAQIADIYSARAGAPAEWFRDQMRAETWYTGDEAVAAGLADEAIKNTKAPVEDPANRFDLTVFNHAGRSNAPAPKPLAAFKEEEDMPEGAPHEFIVNGQKVSDPAEIQKILDSADKWPVGPPAVPQPVTVMVNGATVTDLGAVQNHIVALEEFRAETIKGARNSFVEKLAADGKILASQIEPLQAFAQALPADMYATWTATFEGAAAIPALQQTATSSQNPTGEPNDAALQRTERMSILEEQIAMHKMAGLSDERLKNLPSYKELEALKSTASA